MESGWQPSLYPRHSDSFTNGLRKRLRQENTAAWHGGLDDVGTNLPGVRCCKQLCLVVPFDRALSSGFLQPQPDSPDRSDSGDEEQEEEEKIADTFMEYRPRKLTFGCEHPDAVVETSSLAAVEPPDVTYELAVRDLVEQNKLSGLQLESIVYACQRHEQLLPDGQRCGFFIGDGACHSGGP